MLGVRLAAATAVAAVGVLAAGGGTALASHGETSGGGGGISTTRPPPTSIPTISISPSAVTFPSQDVGTTSLAQTVSVTDTGTSPVLFNAETQGGANAVDFLDLNSQCVGVTIAPGASCALTLQFRPSATGTRTGTIALIDDAAGSPRIINLTGTGTSTAGSTPMTVDTSGLNCSAGVCALGDTIVNNFYFSQMGVQGDTTPPYSWTLASGALPAGVTLAPGGQSPDPQPRSGCQPSRSAPPIRRARSPVGNSASTSRRLRRSVRRAAQRLAASPTASARR